MQVNPPQHPRVIAGSPLVRRSTALAILLAAAAGCGGGDSPSAPACAVSDVTVTAPAAPLQVGKTTTMSASVTQANCSPAIQATWESSQPTVASIDASTGVVTGVAAGGPVTITARAQGKSGTAQISVIPVSVASVTLAPATATIALGETQQLTATPRDADGNVLTGRTVTWTTSDASLATVSATGLVTAVAPSPVTITATVDGKSAAAAISVIAARPANRFAFAWANDPTGTAAYTPSALYAFNATGAAITITRTNAGRYQVVFGRLAKSTPNDIETVMVSAYGASTATRCIVLGWGNSGEADLRVNVACTDAAGVALDSRFSILVVGSQSLPGRSGFAWADNMSAAQYTPSPPYAFSSSGEAPQIQRQATGTYTADLKLSRGATDLPENYFATAYGDPTKMCKIGSWGTAATVLCYTNAGVAVDAQYDVFMIEQGRVGKRLGFAWANQLATASYTPSTAYSRNSSGGGVTINRISAGLYDVTFAGLAKPGSTPENVQVSSYGGAYTYCSVVNWANTGTADLTIRVACSNAAGAATDSYYQILVIE